MRTKLPDKSVAERVTVHGVQGWATCFDATGKPVPAGAKNIAWAEVELDNGEFIYATCTDSKAKPK